MSTALIWLFIALLGLILYLAPLYFTEGFVDMSTNSQPSFPGYIKTDIMPTGNTGLNSIEDFLLNTPAFDGPELSFDKPPMPTEEKINNYAPQATGRPGPASMPIVGPTTKEKEFVPIPIVHVPSAKDDIVAQELKGSSPDTAEITDKISSFLDQGTAFKSKTEQVKKEETVDQTNEVPVAREEVNTVTTIQACPACPPPPKCPPPTQCAPPPPPTICPVVPEKQCPDLRNYVRKDQIPCWGCSLD